jgi:hypothetical protein
MIELDDEDATVVASILKQFIRLLPSPLCTYELYDKFLECGMIHCYYNDYYYNYYYIITIVLKNHYFLLDFFLLLYVLMSYMINFLSVV